MFAVQISHNEKVGPVSATYAPRQTCSKDCPLRNNGCYSEGGNCRMHFDRISRSVKAKSPAQLARLEAKEIVDLRGDLPLRLHVTGDARTPEAARILGLACRTYRFKHNKPVWTYTHAWRSVPREAWSMSISVFASCETPGECVEARANGYAAAFIPLDIKKDRQILRKEHGLRTVLCPHFTRKTPCVSCKLCFNDFSFYEKGRVLLLPPHGTGLRKIENVLRIKRNIPSI